MAAGATPTPDERPDGDVAPYWPISRVVSFWGFATLVILGVAFYLWWGLAFGVWIDNGVYAVTVTLLGFGLAGMWLVLPNPPSTPASPP
jgi:hypothetical protein